MSRWFGTKSWIIRMAVWIWAVITLDAVLFNHKRDEVIAKVLEVNCEKRQMYRWLSSLRS